MFKRALDRGPYYRCLSPVVIGLPTVAPTAVPLNDLPGKGRKTLCCRLQKQGEDALLMRGRSQENATSSLYHFLRCNRALTPHLHAVPRNRSTKGRLATSFRHGHTLFYPRESQWIKYFFLPLAGHRGFFVIRQGSDKKNGGESRNRPYNQCFGWRMGNVRTGNVVQRSPGSGMTRNVPVA